MEQETEKLYDIPGISGYKIDIENKVVYSNLRKKPLSLYHNAVTLAINKKSIQISIDKLVYAVKNNINILDCNFLPPGDWQDIPYFDNYKIDVERKLIYSKLHGRIIGKNHNRLRLRRNGKDFNTSMNKLLYAIKHNIDLLETQYELIEYNDKILTKDKFLDSIRKIKRYNSRYKTDIITEYEKQCNVLNMFIQCYKNNDFSEIIKQFYNCKNNLIRYIRSNRYAYNNTTENELLDATLDIAIKDITEGRLIGANIEHYMRKMLRYVVLKKRQIKCRNFYDNIDYSFQSANDMY